MISSDNNTYLSDIEVFEKTTICVDDGLNSIMFGLAKLGVDIHNDLTPDQVQERIDMLNGFSNMLSQMRSNLKELRESLFELKK